MSGIRYIRLPRRQQRGYGNIANVFSRIGAIFKPILRSIIHTSKPIAKTALKQVANEGITQSANLLTDIAKGKDLKTSVRKRAAQGIEKSKKIAKKGVKDVIRKTINTTGAGRERPFVSRAHKQKRKKSHRKKSVKSNIF